MAVAAFLTMAGIVGPNLHKFAQSRHTPGTLPLYTFPQFIGLENPVARIRRRKAMFACVFFICYPMTAFGALAAYGFHLSSQYS